MAGLYLPLSSGVVLTRSTEIVKTDDGCSVAIVERARIDGDCHEY